MNSIFTRRSVRKFKDLKVEDDKIDLILRAAMQAPSSVNQQPWEFIVVEDKNKIEELAKSSPYAKPIGNSTLTIVVMGNVDRMSYPEYWEQDLGAATQNILLQATELGLGSVWIGVHPEEEMINYVKNCFKLKDNLKPYCMVALGYPIEGKGNKFVDRYDATRVHHIK